MKIIVITIAVFVASCVVSNQTRISEKDSKTCLREYSTGSSIPTLNCSRTKTDAERNQMIEEVRNNRQVNPSGGSKAGGS